MKTKLALSAVVFLSACMSVDTPPRPEGVSWFDHVFGETSVPYAERNQGWTKLREAYAPEPTLYVDALPPGCGDTRDTPKAGCSQRNDITQTCRVWVKNVPDAAAMVCAKRHEERGECAGNFHAPNSVASRSCGPT